MSKFHSRRKLELIYQYPLPINVIIPGFDQCVPTRSDRKSRKKSFFSQIFLIKIIKQWNCFINLIIRNCYIFIKEKFRSQKEFQADQKLIKVKFTKEHIFKVDVNILDSENCDALKLWRSGFFGKGILSRSEPTWYQRTERRLHLVEEKFDELTSEEITKLRRDERKKFKEMREDLEKKELVLELKISEILENKEQPNDIENIESLERLTSELKALKETSLKNLDFKKFIHENKMKLYTGKNLEEDEYKKLLVPWIEKNVDKEVERRKLIQLEYLQLMPAEVFFLNFALSNIIQVINEQNDTICSTLELFIKLATNFERSEFCKIKPSNKFLLQYVVYHHYRSQGWCIRSGVKFGVDYLLYERGPPLSHAKYCLHIINNNHEFADEAFDTEMDFVEYSSISRVVGGVKKNLIFVYVGVTDSKKLSRFVQLSNKLNSGNVSDDETKSILRELLSLYTVSEILYKRWVPSRNRD